MKKADAINGLKTTPTQMCLKGFITDSESVTFNLEKAKKPLIAYISAVDKPGSCPLSIKNAEKVEKDWQLTVAEEGYEEFQVVLSEEVVQVKILKRARFVHGYWRSLYRGDVYQEFESQEEAIKTFESGQFNVVGYYHGREIITSKVSSYEIKDGLVIVTTGSGSKYAFEKKG